MAHVLDKTHAARVGALLRSLTAGMGEQCLSEYSFSNLWLFRREHRYRFTDGPWPYISGYTYDGVHHALPLFELDRAPAEVIDDLLNQHDCLYPVPLAQACQLDPQRFQYTASRDDADYLYPADQFRGYKGAVLGKKRNLMKQLLRDHHVQAVPFGLDWQEQGRAVLAAWMREKGKPEGAADERPCIDALAEAGALGLEGFGYVVDGVPGGFVLAEALQPRSVRGRRRRSETSEKRVQRGSTEKPIVDLWAQEVIPRWTVLSRVAADVPSAAHAPRVYAMRFAKSLSCFKGLAQYMFHHFCVEHEEVRWLNFEQDLGLPNFRQTKQSYQPEALLAKCRVTRVQGPRA